MTRWMMVVMDAGEIFKFKLFRSKKFELRSQFLVTTVNKKSVFVMALSREMKRDASLSHTLWTREDHAR